MSGIVRLLRHPPVHPDWSALCYGASDAPLADGWEIAPFPADVIHHSGLARTRLPAERIAARLGVALVEDARLRERDFGAWEGQSWGAIYRDTGDAMMGMVRDPAVWAPPGGETTFQLRDRVLAWWRELPPGRTILAVTHGGPIAALLGTLRRLSVPHWPGLVPNCGDFAEIGRDGADFG